MDLGGSAETALVEAAPTHGPESTVEQQKDEKRRTVGEDSNRGRAAVAQEQLQLQRTEKAKQLSLKYGASHVIKLIIPISVCMVFVIFTVNTVGYYQKLHSPLPYTPFISKTGEAMEKLWMSFGNALIFICIVVFVTFALILLYKYRWYKVLMTWLFLSSLLLLSFFGLAYIHELFKTYNLPLDYPTTAFIMWNYAVMGMICIHWEGPLHLEQAYHMIVCALMALTFIKFLPDWTPWSVLFIVSVWDLIAVLSPIGPLRMLVETAAERNEQFFPSLVYSSGMLHSYIASGGGVATLDAAATESSSDDHSGEDSKALHPVSQSVEERVSQTADADSSSFKSCKELESSDGANARAPVNHSAELLMDSNTKSHAKRSKPGRPAGVGNHSQSQPVRPGDGGVKLGLGDFVFYSVLVGKASSYGDWNTTIACYIGILVGLCATLLLLAIFQKALPALPISVTIGLIFYMCTQAIVAPFCSQLSMRQLVY